MRLLLDTHAFIWFVTSDPRLSSRADRAIRQRGNELLLSVASVWEGAIKHNLGRLSLTEPFDTFVPEQMHANDIALLQIELRHTFEVARLPRHHRDPFDRLLIAQALTESVPVVSADSAFDAYPVRRVW
jgi:PIN domain nuclease of toxin-antitoxin system